jgi:hypothetical protein
MFRFYKQHRLNPASGLLLVSSGGLGDTILLSIVLERFTKMALLGERVTLVLPKESLKVAFLFNKDIQILPVNYKTFRSSWFYRSKIARQFYLANYRCVISTDFLRHPKLDEMVIKYCEAKEVFAMEPRSWRKYDGALSKNRDLYNRVYDSGPVHLDKMLRWSKYADWLNGTNLVPPRVCLPDGCVEAGQEFFKPTVVLIPFSAVKEKQSPPDVFIEVMEYLKNDYNFVVAGAPGDIDINPEYVNLLKIPNTTFDTSTFEDLAPKLMKADLVVSVDTAAMHLAASLGTPTVCIASAAYVNEIVPYAQEITPHNVRFVFQEMDCQGCLGSCCLPLENGSFPCVARIKPESILTAIDELLTKQLN